jgi:hypothetical protein
LTIYKIISGGQSGVDRSALDFSLQYKIECGGWCPRGRLAEDGIIPEMYPLIETKESEPIYRTMRNIESADGTLIIYRRKMDKGSRQTADYAKKVSAPYLIIDLKKSFSAAKIKDWLIMNRIKILNIAGPRESNSPGIHKAAFNFLEQIKHLF